MTNTEPLSKLFPATTAAGRVNDSIRNLTAGFRYRLLELESDKDPAVAAEAMTHNEAVCKAVHDLSVVLHHAARLFNRQGVQVEGRDLTEEERALDRLLTELRDLSGQMQDSRGYFGHDDVAFERQMARESAGDELDTVLKSRDARWAQGKG